MTIDVEAWAAAARKVTFARPDWLWLLVGWPLIVGLGWWSRAARRRRLLDFGVGAAVARARSPKLAGALFSLGYVALAVGAAGPRWGVGPAEDAAPGRDIVVVLDMSRSMSAEDMVAGHGGGGSRWRAAVESLTRLAASLRRRGGHRVGLVVFAARPKLVCPLTADIDFFTTKLSGLDIGYPPPGVGFGPGRADSGTRIGAALRRAVEAHDSRFGSFQDILLVSDGDDPAGDREWRVGLRAAQGARVPVHAVGLGDPERGAVIPGDGGPLRFDGRPVRSRLREEPLLDTARLTDGLYLPSRTRVPDIVGFFERRVETQAGRELPGAKLPQPIDRSVWFLSPAAGLLFLAWMAEHRAPRPRR